jgi:hypothetical protein
MNRIDFTHNGGFRATQKTWKFVQDNYLDTFSALARLCGDKTILTGVQLVGGVLTDGWISYGAELIRFIGGTPLSQVLIEETPEQILINDTEVPFDAYFTKVARCAVPGTFPFTDLKRLNTLEEMWLPYDVKQVDCPPSYVAANFDSTGLGINKRKGWAVCNGQNGTTNRGGRVSVGTNYPAINVDPSDNVWDVIYNVVGSTGGKKRHLLTSSESGLPDHAHSSFVNGFLNKGAGDGSNAIGSENGGNNKQTGGVTGGAQDASQSHENRQPFIVTLFIQKL